MFIPLALVLLVTGLFWLCSAPRSSSPQVPLPVKVRFAVFGQSGILALAAGGFYWRTMRFEPEPYQDFIGGFLGMSGMPKSFEYTAEYVGLVVFGAAAFLLCRWYRRLVAEPGGAALLARIGFYSLLPGFVMAGQAVTVASLEPLTTLPALAVLLAFPALAVMPAGDAVAASRTAERCSALPVFAGRSSVLPSAGMGSGRAGDRISLRRGDLPAALADSPESLSGEL